MKTFTITVEGECTLAVEEIWPDGDAPDNPTPSDVIAAMGEAASIPSLIREWNLPCAICVDGKLAMEEP